MCMVKMEIQIHFRYQMTTFRKTYPFDAVSVTPLVTLLSTFGFLLGDGSSVDLKMTKINLYSFKYNVIFNSCRFRRWISLDHCLPLVMTHYDHMCHSSN